jgi:hypothetical protein
VEHAGGDRPNETKNISRKDLIALTRGSGLGTKTRYIIDNAGNTDWGLANRPLHLTAPGRARARPSRAMLSLTRAAAGERQVGRRKDTENEHDQEVNSQNGKTMRIRHHSP